MGSKEELKHCVDKCNINKGESTYSNIFIGHDVPIDTLVSKDVSFLVKSKQMTVKVMELQAPTAATIGYLLALDPVTTDCKEVTNAIRANKLFTCIPINVITQPLRVGKDKKGPVWNSNDRIDVVTIKYAGHLMKPALRACKNKFNSTAKFCP